MTRIHITGDFHNLLTHCALWGTASILADSVGPHRVRAGWLPRSGEALINADAVIDVEGLEEAEIGLLIRDLAARVASSEEWNRQIRYETQKGTQSVSLLTPRTGLPETKDITVPESAAWWQHLEDARAHSIDCLSPLEQALARGMGERSWWLSDPKGIRADLGASPWEMKTRNRGEEFLAQRFIPLAHEVSSWSAEEILDGITGKAVRDAVGKNKSDSRTATGLASPGPCDNALAWCALWSFGLFQPVHRTQRPSPVSRGSLLPPEPSIFASRVRSRDSVEHKETLVVAVPERLVSVSAWTRVQRSPELLQLVNRELVGTPDFDAVQAWVRDQGIAEVLSFPVFKSSNASAPERKALQGRRVLS